MLNDIRKGKPEIKSVTTLNMYFFLSMMTAVVSKVQLLLK